MTVIDEIIAKRRSEIEAGTDTGEFIPPAAREFPISEFGQPPFIITEVKKKSPSKGIFTDSFDHIKSASSYIEQGMKNISVITEKNYFAGSLKYLYEIKQKYPDAAVLRKDFLLCENDIEVSYNCGADALLLIASALEKELLEKLYYLTVEKGMKPLVEIHDEKDLEKVRSFKPALVGINSRDLRDFSVNMISPLLLRSKIDWKADAVYESGIGSRSDAVFAFSSGFSGILTGESVIKNPSLASVYKDVYYSIKKRGINPEKYFWSRIFKNSNKDTGINTPLVKICGITNRDDCIAAALSKADIIGMVFADSVRKAEITLPEELADIDIPKVAVTVNPDKSLLSLLKKYYEKGLIDAVQLSGDESPEFCLELDIPFYKTLRIKNEREYETGERYHSVRVLTDSFSKNSYGGTGRKVDSDILENIKEKANGHLWLAGGLSLQNVHEIIRKYSPELIDVSSSLESSPGKKDHLIMDSFVKAVKGE